MNEIITKLIRKEEITDKDLENMLEAICERECRKYEKEE